MKRNSLAWRVYQSWEYYVMILLPLAILITYKYVPLWFNIISFYDYSIFGGLKASNFVGMKNFSLLFADAMFPRIFTNTLLISLLNLLFGFPVPVILALILNEVKNSTLKRTAQTMIYLPHFMSWVVFGNIISTVLMPQTGMVNQIIMSLGGESINFIGSKTYFRAVLVTSDIIKESGWGTIVYLAALTQIDPSLYESAEIDGAGRFRMIISITLPCIASTIVMLFILKLGNLMTANFQQIFVLYNPSVYKVADVFETYIYRNGIVGGDYSYTTAMGLFQSVITTTLVVSANVLSKRMAGYSIW